MMIKPEQMAAARSLLGKDYTQAKLAELAGLDPVSISKFENGNIKSPKQETLYKIITALESEGIVFTDDGVRKPDYSTFVIKGDSNGFLQILDDVYRELIVKGRGRELLIYQGDESQCTPEIIEKVRWLKSHHIRIRVMVCQGDTHLMDDLDNYRYIPQQHFNNNDECYYGKTIVTATTSKSEWFVMRNEYAAENRKSQFNQIWEKAEKPKESTSDVKL
ncbi:MAG: helix-turn-helix domain-containing protein [Reichenbachiella sp.]|uniref:helix-turn-helix domain-containing protein n=1 Tax=Reichenbachiella sp. TaxID=2184521 RepID=UPI0032672C0E